MATSRNINAPGIDLREIDRSQYTVQDNSLPNAPAVLVTGFADKGENYSVKWVNTTTSLESMYGKPKTEFEQIFHNACIEVLNRGGVCLASKLPYSNNESSSYTYCDFQVDNQVHDISSYESTLSALYSKADSNLTSCIEIIDANRSGKISLDEFDSLKVGSVNSKIKNKIRVVDISRGRMQKADFNCVSAMSKSGQVQWSNECLGIFPVIVAPTNALFWQYLNIYDNDGEISDGNEVCLSDFNPVNSLTCVTPDNTGDVPERRENTNLSGLFDNELYHPSSTLKSDETLSKFASLEFPSIPYANASHLETSKLKQVCIVVMQAFTDESNSNKVNYQVLESFVGSLDKRAKSDTGKSIFIDDIVNNSSQYINVFSNIDYRLFDLASTIMVRNQRSTMLGFYNGDCIKKISAKNSIIDPLTIIFENIKDPNQYPIDLIVDAGVTNIAQYVEAKKQIAYDLMTDESYSFTEQLIDSSGRAIDFSWKLGTDAESIQHNTKMWSTVMHKYDDFCKFTRKDCMFITDGIRPFCLEGNEKLVRKTKLGSSVKKDILPKLRYLSGLNSSYSAGYCDWFQSPDFYSGDLMWCPPSIKAASVFIYCDTYFHTWDAPAGMTRGIVPNVVDVAFSPTIEEAGKIYDQSWNYAINYPIDGIIMEGQKTFQTNKTALDRINVRRLLLSLEKKVIRASKYFLYEGNTAYHRQRFVDTIRPFFEDAVNGSGIVEYAIQCDDVLNTPQVIDNNELRCRIAIKPVKTIEFIRIDLITTSQSASVTEEVVK